MVVHQRFEVIGNRFDSNYPRIILLQECRQRIRFACRLENWAWIDLCSRIVILAQFSKHNVPDRHLPNCAGHGTNSDYPRIILAANAWTRRKISRLAVVLLCYLRDRFELSADNFWSEHGSKGRGSFLLMTVYGENNDFIAFTVRRHHWPSCHRDAGCRVHLPSLCPRSGYGARSERRQLRDSSGIPSCFDTRLSGGMFPYMHVYMYA